MQDHAGAGRTDLDTISNAVYMAAKVSTFTNFLHVHIRPLNSHFISIAIHNNTTVQRAIVACLKIFEQI